MANIKLYKNDDLVFEKRGVLLEDKYVFENIFYDYGNNILVRENDDFKYLLDFKNKIASVELKAHNYSLDLKINTISMDLNDTKHIITYSIESEDNAVNILEVFF